MTRWQIMARLVELLELREFIGLSCFVGADHEAVSDIMAEACMHQVSGEIWQPGQGTYNWVIFWTHGAWALGPSLHFILEKNGEGPITWKK